MVKTIAIMQPTYLPWVGYLDLMDQAETFVLLDSVQFDRRSWQQRNRIKTASGELMLTVPVLSKGLRTQKVRDVRVVPGSGFAANHRDSIRAAYARAPHLEDHWDALAAVYAEKHELLFDLNMAFIRLFKRLFGLRCKLVRSSELSARGKKVDLLVALCKELGAGRYLSPWGSKPYIDENNIFAEHGIELVYHSYRHPVYRQAHGPFLTHMSCVDLLLNEGAERGAELLRSGRFTEAA